MCSIYYHHYRALRACETLKGDAALGNCINWLWHRQLLRHEKLSWVWRRIRVGRVCYCYCCCWRSPHVRHRVPSLLGEEQHENDVRFLEGRSSPLCALPPRKGAPPPRKGALPSRKLKQHQTTSSFSCCSSPSKEGTL